MKHFCEDAAAFEGFSKIKQIYISGTEASFMVFFLPMCKGSPKNLSFDKLGLLDQPAWPPPLPGGWDTDNNKKIFDVYFAF